MRVHFLMMVSALILIACKPASGPATQLEPGLASQET